MAEELTLPLVPLALLDALKETQFHDKPTEHLRLPLA
jgi:hypothetical protein